MLNSEICMTGLHNGNNSYNKRLKALEKAIASMSTVVASDKISGNNGEFTNAKVTDTATINKETVEQSTIQDLNAAHIDNRGGFAALGTVTVEALTVGGEVKADYEKAHVTEFAADEADIEVGNIDKANIKTLKVQNKIDKLDLAQLYIDTVLALSQTGLTLKIAEAFHNANFKCSLRPTWQDKPLALQEDATTVFTLNGIIDDDSQLPATTTNGECYFVRNHVDGAMSGPAIAANVNDSWEFVFYPGLDDYVNNNTFDNWKAEEFEVLRDYVNNFNDTLVPFDDKNDFEENPDNYRIRSLYDNITELLHQLNEAGEEGSETWFDWRADVNEFIGTQFPAIIEDIDNQLALKIENPDAEGQYLRKVDEEGNASWIKLSDNDAFVNKNYEETDEEGNVKASTISNDSNGIRLDSNIAVESSTAESTANTTQAIINQEYLRTNLNLSTEATATGKSNYFFEEKGVIPESEHLYLTSTYGNENVWWAMKRNPIDYVIATKDYRYYRFTNYASNEANTYTFLFSVDRKGKITQMATPADHYLNTEAQASVHGSWVGFNPEAYNGETDNVVYYMFPRALINGAVKGYINMYKDGKYYGHVQDVDGESYGIYSALDNPSPSYYRWGGKSLRNSENPRVLIVNDSSNTTDQLKAYLIGVDANGEEALDKGKPIALPAKITWGREGLAAGKNYWWFQNNLSNIFSRIDKDGNIASYTLVDPVEQTALSSTVLRNASNNYIELENGDVMFYVANCQTGLGYDYFIYCSDDPTTASPVTVYRSGVKFSQVESATDRWPLAAQFPFVECGNYVYFFPTTGFNITDGSNLIGSGNSAWWKSVANQYGRFDKTSKSWSFTQVPWTIGNYASYGPAQHLITEDGYLWVFPNQVSDATINGSQCLVIAPSGQATTVDLGTGSAVNFFYAIDLENGWSWYLNHSGNAAWGYGRMQNSLAAVNSHGLGCLISPDLRHMLLFKGNGEFKHYDFSSWEDGFFPQGNTVYRGGPSLIPCKDGFLFGFYHSTAYRLSSAPEGEAYGLTYISTSGSDINVAPTFKEIESLEGDGLFIKYREGYEYNMTFEDYRKRFLTMSEVRMHECPTQQFVGVAIWKETGDQSEGTIYLKDGDYEISSVEV